MKANFYGRIIITAMNYTHNINGGELYDLILGTDPRSLFSLSKLPFSYFPGPLDGSVDAASTLPDEITEMIETQLGAKALKFSNYRLANAEGNSQLLAIFNGLATVAAISRSCMLADELRILVRRYRCDAQYAFLSSIYRANWLTS
jgi:hypothetical protein